MVFRKLIFVAFVALEGVLSLCVPAPTCSCVSSSPITPVGQFVIPAVIKPLLQPEPVVVAAPAPVVETIIETPYGGISAPYSMYPPIIVQDDDDNSHTWLYWLMLAMNRRNNCGCGNNWNGCNNCGYGYNNGNSCGCGNGCGNVYPFAPYPLPCGSCLPTTDCGYPINPCGNGPEINLIIRTPDDCPVASGTATASS